MATRAAIDEFLSHRRLALVRASRRMAVRGVPIDQQLGLKGYDLSVVYLDESGPGQRLRDIEGAIDGVIIAVPPEQSEKAVKEAIEAKIPRVWLQQGAESKAAIALCEEKGIGVVSGACVLMYAEPVKSFHAFHRFLWKTFGRLAK
jgi:uncharacterized protein